MTYANKSHAHRDIKNDYNRLDKRSEILDEIEQSVLEKSNHSEAEEDEDEEDPIPDFVAKSHEICVGEYSRGVKDSRI